MVSPYFLVFCFALFVYGIAIVVVLIKREQSFDSKYLIVDFIFLGLWAWGTFFQILSTSLFFYKGMFFRYMINAGVYAVPVASIHVALVISNRKITWKHMLLYLYTFAIYILCILNDNVSNDSVFYHLLYVNFDFENMVFGKAMSTISLINGIGAIYVYVTLFKFYLDNFAVMTKIAKSMFILSGVLSVLSTLNFALKLIKMPSYMNVVVNCIILPLGYLCFYDYEYSKIGNLGAKEISEMMTDSYVVLDMCNRIVGYNKSFSEMCKHGDFIIKGSYIKDIVSTDIAELIENGNTELLNEVKVNTNNSETYFIVETKPIISKTKFIGKIIFFKDITVIKKMQVALISSENLSLLGVIAAGFAHNAGNKLGTLGGSIDILNDEIEKLENYTDRPLDNKIINNMKEYICDMRNVMIIFRKMLSSMNKQIKSEDKNMPVSEIINLSIELSSMEAKKKICKIITNNSIDDTLLITKPGIIIHAIVNILLNAIQAYDEPGDILLKAWATDEFIFFSIKDCAKGIPENLKSKIFAKPMISTKDSSGTGLYTSYLAIHSISGDINFDSNKNGTEFIISLPFNNTRKEP